MRSGFIDFLDNLDLLDFLDGRDGWIYRQVEGGVMPPSVLSEVFACFAEGDDRCDVG